MRIPKRFKEWHGLNKDIPPEMLKCPRCKSWLESLDIYAPYHWEMSRCWKCKKWLHELKDEDEGKIEKLIQKHTRISVFSLEPTPRVKLRLVVDHQSFDMGEHETVKQAQWMARMLAIAIHRLIEQNK